MLRKTIFKVKISITFYIRTHVMSLKPLAEGILSFLEHASRSVQEMTLQFDSPNV